jgi:hypothetical protein
MTRIITFPRQTLEDIWGYAICALVLFTTVWENPWWLIPLVLVAIWT